MKKKILLTPIALVASTLVSGVYAQDRELSPVTVTGSRDGYIVNSTSSATRTDTPIEQIPQTVVVVPKKLIEDQGSTTLADAVKSVSNIQERDQRDLNTTIGANSFRIRGFQAGVTVDGVAVPGFFANQEPVININQIDVIKGPTGSLYGGSQSTGYDNVGGSIAITSNAPEKTAHNEAGFRVGSYNHRAAFADINQPINDQLGIRLVAQVQDADSETDRVTSKQTFIAPSISLRPNKDSELILRLRHMKSDYLSMQSGLPAAAKNANLRNAIVTAEGMPKSKIKSDTTNLQWVQKLDEVWGWGFTFAKTNTNYDASGIFLGNTSKHIEKMESTVVSPYVTAKFNTEAAQHKLIAGYESDSTKDNASIYFSHTLAYIGAGNTYSYTTPYSAWVDDYIPASMPLTRIDSKVESFYLQDQIDYGRLHLQVGIKESKTKINERWMGDALSGVLSPAAYNQTNSTSKILPRLGGVYDLSSNLGVFAGYGEGLRLSVGGSYQDPIKPEMSKQTEVGLKFKNWNGIYGTLAWFDLTRTNVPGQCTNQLFACQVGKQNSTGVDLDLRWRVTSQLTALFGFSNQDAKTVEDTKNTNNIGKQIRGVPETTYRLGVQHDIRSGDFSAIGVGGGARYHSKLPVNSQNTAFTDSATLYDAHVSYTMKDVKFALVVNNLLDKKYWIPSSANGATDTFYFPALRRTVMFTSSLSF